MVKIKLVNGGFFVQSGLLESEFNGVLPAMLGLQIGESFKYGQEIGILFVCILEDGIKFLGHDLEP